MALLALAARPHLPGSLAAWCEAGPPGEFGPLRLRTWQRKLCARLQRFAEDVVAGRDPRLNVSAPQQEGKSELIARRFLTWVMANYNVSVGMGSYGHDLATEHSRAARELLRSGEAKLAWPHLAGEKADEDDDNGQKLVDKDDDWSIPSRTPDQRNPRYIARGVGGGLSGRTLALFAADDAFKDEADYGSGARREQVRRWLRSVVLARIRQRGGGLVNIGTRYGTDDVHGMLETWAKSGGTPVESFNVPLRAKEDDDAGREPGEYISEGWTPEKEARTRAELGSRMASAILDCSPTPDEGGAWKRTWFSRRYKGDPAAVARLADLTVLALDGAATAGGGDCSVLVWWGIFGGKARKLGQWRDQLGFPDLLALCRDVRAKTRPNALLVEDASAGRQAIQTLELEFPVTPVKVSKSKRVRYNAVSPLWESGAMEYPEEADWMADYIERMVVIQGEGDEVDDEADADAIFGAWWLEHGGEPDPSDVLEAMREAGW